MSSSGVHFADFQAESDEYRKLRQKLEEKNVRSLNGGSSLSRGPISKACRDCATTRLGRTFLISTQCNRDCFFCFNPNQIEHDATKVDKVDWRAEMQGYVDAGVGFEHIALTGGEPLIHRDESIAFFQQARRLFPNAHTRLYTNGDLLDSQTLQILGEAGLNEIRFSVKHDDPPSAQESTIKIIREAKKTLSLVGVEMPVVPGYLIFMKNLLDRLDDCGVDFINLLELCYPFHNWRDFEDRGLFVKNPPFPTLYRYTYAGGLPIAGSELACMELLLYSIDHDLSMGVHYCSLENKHREQVFSANVDHATEFADFEFSGDDYLLRTIKVFGRERGEARRLLEGQNFRFSENETKSFLQCHPKYRNALDDAGLHTMESINIIEERPEGKVIRELDLR